MTVSQQMRWPVAKGTFSTASTCQISWGWTAWGTTTARCAAAPRAMDAGADEGELEATDRGQAALGRVLAELETDQARRPRQGARA